VVTASFISRLSHAVDLIEKWIQQNRPLKVVQVRAAPLSLGGSATLRRP
jgi:hypothetical protein